MSSALPPEPSAVHVVEATGTITALDLEGEFDIASAPDLLALSRRVLAEGRHLIVNLSEATFIDSSIVQTLFAADAAAKSAGRSVVLQFGTHAAVERVLSITSADKKLRTAATRAEAIASIEQSCDSA